MKEKAKAKELIAYYRYALSLPNAPLGDDKHRVAKQCALICVDEIIKVLNSGNLYMEHGKEDSNTYDTSPEYWEAVKSEIEAL
jgi:hypothetical protein